MRFVGLMRCCKVLVLCTASDQLQLALTGDFSGGNPIPYLTIIITLLIAIATAYNINKDIS